MCDKLRAFRFDEHEITDRELRDVAILERAAEIFRTKLNPAFTDLDVRVGMFFRFDVDPKVIACDVIADEAAFVVCRSEQNIR